MLDEASYQFALYCYVGAAAIILLYLVYWLNRHWSRAAVALTVLLCAAIMLTPAYPKVGVTTMAPALIVALFQLALEGPEAAEHAVKPMMFSVSVALGLALLLRLTVLRPRRIPKNNEQQSDASSQ